MSGDCSAIAGGWDASAVAVFAAGDCVIGAAALGVSAVTLVGLVDAAEV